MEEINTNSYMNNQNNPPVQQQAMQQKTDVLGIISIVLSFAGLSLIGFILGLVGASQAKKRSSSPVLSRIGWILGLVSTFMTLAVLILVLAGIPALQANQRNSARQNDVARIEAELARFYSENRYYPPNIASFTVEKGIKQPSLEDIDYQAFPNNCTKCDSYTIQPVLE